MPDFLGGAAHYSRRGAYSYDRHNYVTARWYTYCLEISARPDLSAELCVACVYVQFVMSIKAGHLAILISETQKATITS
jgi:hypothetical protein